MDYKFAPSGYPTNFSLGITELRKCLDFFLIWSGCFRCLFYPFKILPESKGKSLEELEMEFVEN
jgi:hypothetical protein